MLSRTMATRKKHDFWDRIVNEFRAGGITQKALARKHGVGEAALKYHLYKGSPKATQAIEVLPVSVDTGAELEIQLGGSVVLRFGQRIDPRYVARLITAFKSC